MLTTVPVLGPRNGLRIKTPKPKPHCEASLWRSSFWVVKMDPKSVPQRAPKADVHVSAFVTD